MLKYTITAKNAQGAVLFNEEIEGKVAANKQFNALSKQEEVVSVDMTRYLITTGIMTVEKSFVREPIIVQTLTIDDGETVETGYIYQEEDEDEDTTPELHIGDIISVQHIADEEATIGTIETVSHDAEYIANNCRYAVLFRKNAAYAQAYWVSIGGITKVELVERPVPPQPIQDTTPLQHSLMSFFRAVAMWATFQEVNAWEVAPADDTAWLHAFQAADEWIAEHGHPSECVCGFCREVAQDALQAVWDALQAVPAYIEREKRENGWHTDYCSCCQRERQFKAVGDTWECLRCTAHIWQTPAPDEYGYQNWLREKRRYYAEVL